MQRFEEKLDARTGERVLLVSSRGAALTHDSILNKGTCFTHEERELFGLEGLLPPGVSTPAEQEARAYGNYLKEAGDIDRYLFLAALQDRNETLFFRLLLDHLEEMAPIVYTPTVGRACELYSQIYRRPRGLYVCSRDRGRIEKILRHAPNPECRVMVITDNEAILGLGDLGVGGMGICIGKLALYTAAAGIHPALTLPIDLDVGTENQALLEDPLYLGVRHRRLRGDEYFSLVDELVAAIAKVFPAALVQWEDFANQNAFQVLDRYRRRLPSFDDDVQGTGAVVLAGIESALRQAGRKLTGERVVFLGAGAAGGGCALMVRRALRDLGIAESQLAEHVLCLDSQGLLLSNRRGLSGHKQQLAASPQLVAQWSLGSGPITLGDVVRNFKPTVLVGTSGQPGVFNEAIIKAMQQHCARPVVLPLSNPTSKSEAAPADLLRWTNGAALIGTGSPFPPVQHLGETYHIGQGNNVLIFPGVGLGALVTRARWLPDEAFLAASRALSEISPASSAPGTPLFPPLSRLREVSFTVAAAVARALIESEAAPPMRPDKIEENLAELVWEPTYLRYRPATG